MTLRLTSQTHQHPIQQQAHHPVDPQHSQIDSHQAQAGPASRELQELTADRQHFRKAHGRNQ